MNRDGVRGLGELGIPGVTILVVQISDTQTLAAVTSANPSALYTIAGSEVWATVTDYEGNYHVNAVPVGFDYVVIQYDLFDHMSTTPNVILVHVLEEGAVDVAGFGDWCSRSWKFYLPLI